MGKPISDKQKLKISQLITDHHLVFTVEVLGPDAIAVTDYNRLVRQGMLEPKALEHTQVSMQAAHTLGKLSAAHSDVRKMEPVEFWQFVETAPPQFSSHDLDAIEASRLSVGRLIANLGVGLLNELENATHEEATKLRHEALSTVQHEIALGASKSVAKHQIEKRLRAKLGESERNWALVVQTELHNAQEQGKSLGFARGGRDPLVFKRPRPDACRFCKVLYLRDGVPRLFKLSELVKNGTNIGRRARRPVLRGVGATEWKAVVGCVHPGCQCDMYEMPDGMGFDKQGKMVVSLRKSVADSLTSNLRALLNHRCEV